MTAIAYRNGILVADTLEVAGDIRIGLNTTKLARGPDGGIMGTAGFAPSCFRFLREFRAGANIELASIDKDDDFEAIVVTPDGEIQSVSRRGSSPVNAEFYALGCAWEFLMGAMAAGASAEQAVALAIEHCPRCGGEVQTLKLPELREARRT